MLKSRDKSKINHALRAAINTPIQGSAADVVIAAMVKIHRDVRFKALGWRMLLQIHDEIVLEGPEESAEMVLQMVRDSMENAFDFKLTVALEVDAKIADSWYDGK